MKYLFLFLPSFIGVPLRRLFGYKIGKGTRIKIGTLILCENFTIGKNNNIGPFCLIRGEKVDIGDNNNIKALSILSAKEIILDSYTHIAPLVIIDGSFTPNSKFVLGDHSRIFPFSWLDTGEGISIGKQVGIGGHTLIFTHGYWPNYLEGGPVSFGSVIIEDFVWLPWRVFVMPGVTIGQGAIIGANSTVNKSVPSNSLVAGSPGKIIKQDINKPLSFLEKKERFFVILNDYVRFNINLNWIIMENGLFGEKFRIDIYPCEPQINSIIVILDHSIIDETKLSELKSKYTVLLTFKSIAFLKDKNNDALKFINFMRRYGIRMSILEN